MTALWSDRSNSIWLVCTSEWAENEWDFNFETFCWLYYWLRFSDNQYVIDIDNFEKNAILKAPKKFKRVYNKMFNIIPNFILQNKKHWAKKKLKNIERNSFEAYCLVP